MNRIILGVMLILAVYYDSKENRIPNRLCGAGILAGILWILHSCGDGTGAAAVVWACGMLVCFFPLWVLRVLGGGDVKLLVAAGLLLGDDSISFLICSGICAGIHALILMICRKNSVHRLTVFLRYVKECAALRILKPYPFDRERDYMDGGIRLSYGLMMGHLIAMITGMYH